MTSIPKEEASRSGQGHSTGWQAAKKPQKRKIRSKGGYNLKWSARINQKRESAISEGEEIKIKKKNQKEWANQGSKEGIEKNWGE